MTICTTGTHTCLDVNTELVLELGCCRMELASEASDGDLCFGLASWLHTIGFMIFASETEVLKLKKSKTIIIIIIIILIGFVQTLTGCLLLDRRLKIAFVSSPNRIEH